MKSKKLEGLSVVECRYGDWLWKLLSDDDSEIFADLQVVKSPREFDDYQLCGLYHKAGVPFDVFEVQYKPIEGMRVHEEIVNAYCHTILDAAKGGNPILFAGGHCTFAPGVAGGLRRALGEDKKIGIVWVDGHDDLKTEKTSDDRFLAGLPLATIIGLGMERWRLAAGLEKPLEGRFVLHSDCRVLTQETQEDIDNSGVTIVDTIGFNDPKRWSYAVNKLAEQVDVIYLHVDIDILYGKYIPAFLVPTPGGNELTVVMDNIRTVMDTGKVFAFGVFNTCFMEGVPGQEITTLTGMKLIAAGLENWKEHPEIKHP